MESVAIIIPVYKEEISSNEMISLNQCFKVLGDYKIIFVSPEKMKDGIFYKKMQSKSDFIFLENKNFESITTYNYMLLSIWFYEFFSTYRYILIYQLDAFVFRDELMFWVRKNYSYIGAPWFLGNSNNEVVNEFMDVGNGGLSLRNVEDCIAVLKSNKKIYPLNEYISRNKNKSLSLLRAIKHFVVSYSFKTVRYNNLINEDKMFALAGKRFSFFKIPKPEIAIKFSFEKQPKKLYKINENKLPFGCHAWWTYDLSFFSPFIKECGHTFK